MNPGPTGFCRVFFSRSLSQLSYGGTIIYYCSAIINSLIRCDALLPALSRYCGACMGEKEILGILSNVIRNSYSPYSRFRVASAVLCEDGRIYTGVNVENSSYGLSMCAERVAVFKAVSEGCRKILRVYVTSDHDKPIPPCGACLQVISEFSPEGSTEIVMLSPTGEMIRKRLTDMLTTLFKGEILQARG